MVYRDNVCSKLCKYSGYLAKLTGLIHKLYAKVAGSSRCEKTALDNSRKNGNVDITTRYHTYNFLSLNGELIEHHRRNGNRTCALGYHLVLFDERENCR